MWWKQSKGWIYLIEQRHNNIVKIGYSKQPDARIKQLQTSSPYQLKVAALIPGGFKLETEIQRKFKKYHIEREWFEDCKEIREYFKSQPKKTFSLNWIVQVFKFIYKIGRIILR